MVVEPLPGRYQESLAVGAVRDLIAQNSHHGAALVLGHPFDAQAFTGLLLVVEQGAPARVRRTQRDQVRRSNVQFAAKMAKQGRGTAPRC